MKPIQKLEVPAKFQDSDWVKAEYAKHNAMVDAANEDDGSYSDFCHNCLCDSLFSSYGVCLYCGES